MSRPRVDMSREDYNARRRENYRTDGGHRREQSRAYMLGYRKRRPEVAIIASKKSRKKSFITYEGRAKTILRTAERRAKKKGVSFNLDLSWFLERIKSECVLSGFAFELQPMGDGRGLLSASVDRIDNSKGYTKDNCRLIAWGLNAAFSTWGEEKFIELFSAYMARRKCST